MKRYRVGEEGEMESMDMAYVLMLLSRSSSGSGERASSPPGRVFECKTCNRQFPSFQALGGHRASHKKPRVIVDGNQNQAAVKPRTHECAICGLEFGIGQALGGHMRRHRALTEEVANGHAPSEKKNDADAEKTVSLDLNLPPSGVDVERRTMVFGIELVQTTPMVGCFY